MVRIIPCHHFQGQRITKCSEKAVGLALAQHYIIIALNHKIEIFTNGDTKPLSDKDLREIEIGVPYKYVEDKNIFNFKPKISGDGQLSLYNTFPTIDLIKNIEYNDKGQYLMCLEKGEDEGSSTKIRVYFQWEKRGKKPMTARIYGVSPEFGSDDAALIMIEFPKSVLSAASCKISGHIVSICEDYKISLFAYRIKEGSGRVKYSDFDHLYKIETNEILPTKIYFLKDFIACQDSRNVLIFKLSKSKKQSSLKNLPLLEKEYNNKKPVQSNKSFCDKVIFDPKNETVRVNLKSIRRTNQQQFSPDSDFTDEINEELEVQRTKFFDKNSLTDSIIIEDLIRVFNSSSEKLTQESFQICLYPVRIMENLGGVACIISTKLQAHLYHLPTKDNCNVVRVTTFPFTAPLISISYDDLFLQVLTETGLLTFTCRSLYYALKDFEGFNKYKNDCPGEGESPTIVGIKPFLGSKFIATNANSLCLLASPSSTSSTTNLQQTANNEDNQSTIYYLIQPDFNAVFEDFNSIIESHKETNPETYLAILNEIHILLRTFLNSQQSRDEKSYQINYREVCRKMGFHLLKLASEHTDDVRKSDEILDKGVTYLLMSNFDLPLISENIETCQKSPYLIKGIVKIIEMILPKQVQSAKLSPTLFLQLLEFLGIHSPEILVKLVIKIPFIRECNTSRLIEILKETAENNNYRKEESLALLLTLLAKNGLDMSERNEIKEIFEKCQPDELLLYSDILIDNFGDKPSLTDLTVCLSLFKPHLLIRVFSEALKSSEITINNLMIAFGSGINLNSEILLRKGLKKTLEGILEIYFQDKLKFNETSCIFPPPTLSEDEIRGLKSLTMSYFSQISFTTVLEADFVRSSFEFQIFGRIPSFINIILEKDPHNSLSSSSQTKDQSQNQGCSNSIASDDEAKECFIKMASLLGSCLVNVKGVKELVQEYLEKKGSSASPSHISLKLLVESQPEKAITTVINKFPKSTVFFAKETFGKNTKKWKYLVEKLKEKIQINLDDSTELYTTIIESIYLHLANSLLTSELEEVLDKEKTENVKFYEVSGRIDLANRYSDLVIEVSADYLKQQ